MKIAYLSATFPPLSAGMGSACFYTADLIGKNNEVSVFLAQRKNINYQKGNYVLKLFKPWFSYGYANLAPQLFWRLKNFEIIHIYYPYFGVVELLCLFKKLSGKKYPKLIFHYQMDMVGEGISKIINRIYKILVMPWLFNLVDAVFVLSEDYARNSDLKKYLKKYKQKFYIVPNGVDVDKFNNQLDTKTQREQLGLKDHEQIIFTAQALDHQHFFKGIDILIKALKIINRENVKLVIAGSGDLQKYYEDLTYKFCVQDKVIFLGRVDHNQLPNYYALADIVAIPSTQKTESFSVTAVEAMASGKPVVVSNLPGLRVTAENNISGLLVEPNNENDLAEKILFLIDHKDMTTSMGQAARKRAIELYDWRKICVNIKNFYSKLLK
ncbi:MAG TPA: glycosyltransferase family 4 protein [bacterium]|nr:glycosyltransferase family 4 protein [bacterium]